MGEEVQSWGDTQQLQTGHRQVAEAEMEAKMARRRRRGGGLLQESWQIDEKL